MKVNNKLLNNHCANEKSERKLEKYLETNKNENATYQNLEDTKQECQEYL